MFTGIVECKGSVVSVSETEAGRRLVVEAPGLGSVEVGASIAVNGVCLTAVAPEEDRIALDIVPETLARTNLGALARGDTVNLERPMPASGRFDGHIVQGHVDGVGTIGGIEVSEGATVMTVTPPPGLMRYIVEKGSVTVDGVSLTVASLNGSTFSVALIPHTLEITTLGLRRPGDQVNLEVDVLAKYVERLVSLQR